MVTLVNVSLTLLPSIMSSKSAHQVLLTSLRVSPFLSCARLMQIHQDCKASITCFNKQDTPVPNNHLCLHWLPHVLWQDSIFKFTTIPLLYQQFTRRLQLSKTSSRPLDFSRSRGFRRDWRLIQPITNKDHSVSRILHAVDSDVRDTGYYILTPSKYVYVHVLRHNFLSSLEQIQTLTFWPKVSTSPLTPFRSTSRPRISSVRKQFRSLDLLQELTTPNGFFNKYR